MENFMMITHIKSSVCKELIEWFKFREILSSPGLVGEAGRSSGIVDKTKKDSHDISIDPKLDLSREENFCINSYLQELNKCKEKYEEKFIFASKHRSWGLTEPFNIQYYRPNGGFKVWHSERSEMRPYRVFAWMTYLNTVDDAGETEFFYQRVKIKPEIGKTVIWPADWTYTHRGIPSPTQDKYIITGWFDYLHENETTK